MPKIDGGYHDPRPVDWSPERTERGASTPPGPRCPAPGCPVRWVSGSSRPCPEHGPAIPPPPIRMPQWQRDTLAYMLRQRGQWPTMIQRRIMLALLRDPRRPNPEIGDEARADPVYVLRVRHELEAAGLIEVYRPLPGCPLPPVVRDRIRSLLSGRAPRPAKTIARMTGCGFTTVRKIRDRMEADRELHVWRRGEHQAGCWCEPSERPAPSSSVIARELLADDPARLNQDVASLAGAHQTTVSGIRHRMEAAREICVYRFGRHQPGCWCAMMDTWT